MLSSIVAAISVISITLCFSQDIDKDNSDVSDHIHYLFENHGIDPTDQNIAALLNNIVDYFSQHSKKEKDDTQRQRIRPGYLGNADDTKPDRVQSGNDDHPKPNYHGDYDCDENGCTPTYNKDAQSVKPGYYKSYYCDDDGCRPVNYNYNLEAREAAHGHGNGGYNGHGNGGHNGHHNGWGRNGHGRSRRDRHYGHPGRDYRYNHHSRSRQHRGYGDDDGNHGWSKQSTTHQPETTPSPEHPTEEPQTTDSMDEILTTVPDGDPNPEKRFRDQWGYGARRGRGRFGP